MKAKTPADKKKVIDNWDREPIIVDYTKNGKQYQFIYKPEENEVFEPLYLRGTPENKKKRFFKVRNELPRDWFMSSRGYILKVSNDGKITFYKGQVGERIQAKFKGNITAQFEALYIIVFGGKCTTEAEKLLDDHGIKAFYGKDGRGKQKKDYQQITLQHINKITPWKSDSEIYDMLPINCNLKDIELVTIKENKLFPNLNGDGLRKRLLDDTTISDLQEFSKIARNTLGEHNSIIMFDEENDTGSITNFDTISLKQIFGNKIIIFESQEDEELFDKLSAEEVEILNQNINDLIKKDGRNFKLNYNGIHMIINVIN